MTEEEIKALQAQLEAEKAEKAQLEETNKKLYARTKAAEGFIQDSDGSWVKREKPKEEITRQEERPSLTEDKIWEVADLIRQGYTRKDAEFLMANGGTKALEDPNSYASIALKTVMEQRQAEQAASQTTSGGGGDTTMPLPEEKMRELSSAELEKILPHN